MVLVQQIINALALGSIYALIALGYTMVYGIVKLLNFAHGDLLMVGAFAGYLVLSKLGVTPLSFILAFLFAMLLTAVLAMIMERVAYKPLRNAPRINALITAIGISFILENGAKSLPFIGPNPYQFPTFQNVNIQIGDLNVSMIQILVFVIAILLMVLLNYVVNFTKMGKAMRAVSNDRQAALLMGIDVNRVITFTFAIGGALAAAAGILYASSFPQINPYMGMFPGLKAFVAAVLGGIGSIPGAMIGAFILAFAETLTKGYISSTYADAVAFGCLIIILIVKPAGIMGKDLREKV